ncbi:MAG: hypothetical protein K2K91_03350 [Ruminococcus sp.]|nr:hypothetical protein [Ruminococcus sp.]
MSHKNQIIISIVASILIILTAICLYVQFVHMDIEANELAQVDNWRKVVTYEMLSDKLKEVISEEEFNDCTDSGKYNMYCKLENLELEKPKRHDPSTSWWKTPPFDRVKTDDGDFYIDFRIDYRTHLTRIEVINIITYISPVSEIFQN